MLGARPKIRGAVKSLNSILNVVESAHLVIFAKISPAFKTVTLTDTTPGDILSGVTKVILESTPFCT